MLHIKKILERPFPLENPSIEKALKRGGLLFDIETTGLAPRHDRVVLIGFLRFDASGKPVLNQLFLENEEREAELLDAFGRIAAASDFYITYNGGSFDVPFLNRRMQKHGLPVRLDPFYNVDLLRIFRKSLPDPGLPDFKLKTLEARLGLVREDVISGRESVAFYKSYLEDRDPLKKEKILLHNAEDVLNLFGLLKLFESIETPERFFDFSQEIHLKGQGRFRLLDCKRHGGFLTVSGRHLGPAPMDWFFSDGLFSFRSEAKTGDFMISLPVLSENAAGHNHLFLDLSDIPFAREDLLSFISENPKRLHLATDDRFDFGSLSGFIRILLEKILT